MASKLPSVYIKNKANIISYKNMKLEEKNINARNFRELICKNYFKGNIIFMDKTPKSCSTMHPKCNFSY
jgi:hypothetical protein